MNIDRKNILSLYRPYVRLFLVTIVVAIGLVVVLSFILPYKYKAATTLMPPEDKGSNSGLSSLLAAAPISIGLGGSDNKSTMTFLEILKSRTLLEGVVDTLELAKNSLFANYDRWKIVGTLAESIVAEGKKSGLITINMDVKTGWFPNGEQKENARLLSADLANSCVVILDKMNKEKSVSQARRSRMYIERLLQNTRHEIDSIQDVFKQFQRDNKVLALDDQVTAIVTNAVSIGSELAKAEIELNIVKMDFQNSSQQVQLMQKRVESLKEQYQKVQQGGLVSTDGFSIPLDQIPTLTKTYTNLIRDLKIHEQINAYLESQRMQELIQESKDIPTVITLDLAVAPLSQDSPARVTMSILAIIVLCVVFVVGVPVREALRAEPS
ncbi:MAG: hypothetical protein HQ472_01845 [Ignavibacteria bacterium]|nr:hypothetical protein [Ignavibacteria bacterium]